MSKFEQIVGDADLARLLDRQSRNTERTTARFQAVEDALASQVSGQTIDTSDVGKDGMECNVDSPRTNTTTTNYAGSPWWYQLIAMVLVAVAVLGAVAIMKPSSPSPTPAPAGHLDVIPGLPDNPTPVPVPNPSPGGGRIDVVPGLPS
jgi:hypothetical protein